MRKHFICCAALLGGGYGLLAAGSANAQNLLVNGNLDKTYAQVIVDNAPPGAGAEDFFLPKPQNWVNEGFRTITGPYEDEMSSEPWAGPAPTPVTADANLDPHPVGPGGPDGAVFFKPFSGNTTPNGPATGHLYQDVPGVVGATYTLTGWAGAEPNALMADAVLAVEFIGAGGTEIPASGNELSLLPTLFVDNGEAFDYKQYSVSAVAPAGTVSVRARISMIGAMGNPAGGGQAYVVDDFVLTPEPTGLALCAIAAAPLLGRRRRA
jgi:hypothetical protein